MSTSSRRWVKLWHEILTDSKFQDLSLEQQARWYSLLIYISAHGEKGKINISAPGRSIINLLQCRDFNHLIICLKLLPFMSIIIDSDNATLGVTFLKWSKYQIDSTVYDRVKKFRSKQDETQMITPKEKEEEKEEEKEKNKKKDKTLYAPSQKISVPEPAAIWPDKDRDFLEFLKTQKHLVLPATMFDYIWWTAMSHAIPAIDIPFVDKEFAKMAKWIMDNKSRAPTQKRFRQFAGSWFERAYNQDRRIKK